MAYQPARILDDLRGVVHGELHFDDLTRALYSTDASIFQVPPLGVVVPRDEEDVRAVVRYAAEQGIPIAARGAGSGMAGESLSPGLILDFSRHFRAITVVSSDTVQVQPGVVYRDLNERLVRIGRRFAPDPASGAQCTIGGMLATNASGARALKYGYTRDHVAKLRAVLADGEVDWFGREPLPPVPAEGRKSQLVAALAPLLERSADLIAACRPKTRFNRCGYLLHDLLSPESVDLARLLVGTEGTLGLFTEARLRTIPLPAGRALVLLGFDRLDTAARAVPRCLALGPCACELLDRRLLTLTRDAYPEYERVLAPGVEAVLLVEFESDVPREAENAANALARQFLANGKPIRVRVTVDVVEVTWLWRLRDLALPMLYSMPGLAQPVPYLEDVGVPPDQLADYLHEVQDILQRHETTASFLIHAGAGQVHTRPFLDLRRPDHVAKLRAIADEVFVLALNLGGTVSTQHGVGLARTPWVARQYGRLFQVFQEVKALFDPANLLNPGKIVGQGSDALSVHLRRAAATDPPQSGWRLGWKPAEVSDQCHTCNGCGACRTENPAQRMCPIFRAQHTEAATPRAKANLLRSLLDGSLPAERLRGDDVRTVADLCVNCQMCALECPAHVNIPKLMLEAKALHAAEHGLRLGDRLLARFERVAALGSFVAPLANAALRNSAFRWLVERIFGLSRRRILPRFAPRSLLTLAERKGWTRPPRRATRPRVAYFVDTYANYIDPELGLATVAVLQHNEHEVFVPPGQAASGMAALALGDVDTARGLAEKNLRVFADLARAGFTIVCSEPTAALMIRQEYRDLVDDPDVGLVAERTVELSAFLWRLHTEGRLRTDFRPLEATVGHHVPCHVKALQQSVAGPRLLALIPGLRSRTIDVSCSGMAGTYGLRAENYENSLAAGAPMLARLARPDLLFGSSECSACRLQMEQGARKRSLHPVQYLALAYGLLPELAARLGEEVLG